MDIKIVEQVPLYTILDYTIPYMLITNEKQDMMRTCIIGTAAKNPSIYTILQKVVYQILKNDKGKNAWDITGHSAFERYFNESLGRPYDFSDKFPLFKDIPHLRLIYIKNITITYTTNTNTSNDNNKSIISYLTNRGGRVLFYKFYRQYYYKDNVESQHHTTKWANSEVLETSLFLDVSWSSFSSMELNYSKEFSSVSDFGFYEPSLGLDLRDVFDVQSIVKK